MNKQFSFSLLVISPAILLASFACNAKPTAANNNSLTNPSVNDSSANAVSFKIEESSRRKLKDDEEITWLATYESTAGQARFQISLILKKATGDPPLTFSKGAFIRDSNKIAGYI
jgi:hypothetical protein